MMRSLRSVNLNLLPVLREILRKRSVTRAAEALGMSQPAASDALRQLRKSFSDELLVLDGRQYVPTALAARLEQELEIALGIIEDMTLAGDFDPAAAIGNVKIASNDYTVLTWGAQFAARLGGLAPQISIEFEDTTIDSAERVMAGLVDFAILPSDAPDMVRDRFHTVDLFSDDLICLVPAHGSVGVTITYDELTKLPHATYLPRGNFHQSLIRDVLERESVPYRPRVSVPVFSLLPHLVATTGSIALTLRRLAEIMPPHPAVRIVELPFRAPKFNVVAISRKDAHRDLLLRWLQGEIAVAAQ